MAHFPAPLLNGLTLDSNNTLYALTTDYLGSTVYAFDSNDSLRWFWSNDPGRMPLGRVLTPPCISPNGTTLFCTTEDGCLHALQTATLAVGQSRELWRFAVRENIRCSPVYDADIDPVTNGLQPQLYILNAVGDLQALDPATGTLRWTRPLRAGLPAASPSLEGSFSAHAITANAPPIIDSQHRVIVVTANAMIRVLSPAGVELAQASLRTWIGNNSVEVEAPLAIAANGTICGATRRFETFPGAADGRAVAFAFRLGTNHAPVPAWPEDFQGNPAGIRQLKSEEADGRLAFSPGVIAGVVADRLGGVYFTEYGHVLTKIQATTGDLVANWSQGEPGAALLLGKLCATPALTESGLAIVAQSDVHTYRDQSFASIGAVNTCSASESPLHWNWSIPLEYAYQDPVGSLDFLGAPVVRPDGRIYVGDTQGYLRRFQSAARLEVGGWPNLQSDNRHSGQERAVEYLLEELPSYYLGSPSGNVIQRLDVNGRILGQASGGLLNSADAVVAIQAGAMWDFGSLVLVGDDAAIAREWIPRGANRFGLCVGERTSPKEARVWENGIRRPGLSLTSPLGFTDCRAVDVSDTGLIVGVGVNQLNGQLQPVKWTKEEAGWIAKSVPFNGGSVQLAGCSDLGRLCGSAQFDGPGGTYRAFITQQQATGVGMDSDLGRILGLAVSESRDVDDFAGVVGSVGTGNVRQAFWCVEAPQDSSGLSWSLLPRLASGQPCAAMALNCSRVVVGNARNSSGSTRACRWTQSANGTWAIEDLNNLPALPSGLVLTSAVGITDLGTIAGYGTRNGATRTWILRPKT